MSVVFVNGNSSFTNTITLSVTAGNLIVLVAGSWTGSSASTYGVSDTAGNAYTKQAIYDVATFDHMAVWTAVATTTGSITVTVTGLASFIGMAIGQYSGVNNVVDGSAGTARGSGTTGTIPNITTTVANDLLLYFGWSASVSVGGTSMTYSPADITNRVLAQGGGGPAVMVIADRVVTSTGTYGGETWTSNGNNEDIVALALTATQPPPTNTPIMLAHL